MWGEGENAAEWSEVCELTAGLCEPMAGFCELRLCTWREIVNLWR